MIMANALSSTCLKLSSLSLHKTCSHREAPVADESGISVRTRTPKDLIIQCSRSNAAIASVLSSVMLRSHSGLGKKWALKGTFGETPRIGFKFPLSDGGGMARVQVIKEDEAFRGCSS